MHATSGALVSLIGPGALRAKARQAAPFPLGFFSRRSEGDGRLTLPFSSSAVHARSFGQADDGTMILDQIVETERKPTRQRAWAIREIVPGRYARSVSDAAGPVRRERMADRLRSRFRMSGNPIAEQWLTIAADGRSAQDRMAARKIGMVVARLDEMIHHVD